MDDAVALFVDGDVVAVVVDVVVNVVVGVVRDVTVAVLFCCGTPWWLLLSFCGGWGGRENLFLCQTQLKLMLALRLG